MARHLLHALMAAALIACIASLIDTALSDTSADRYPCPLCGGPTECTRKIQNRTPQGKLVSVSGIYRCAACDYEILLP